MSLLHRRSAEPPTVEDVATDPLDVDGADGTRLAAERPPSSPGIKTRGFATFGIVAVPQPRAWVPLRSLRNGVAYRIASPQGAILVTPALAMALETVFERFAHDCGFEPRRPLVVGIDRGYAPHSAGHFEGRAADIAAVGGIGLAEWARRWQDASSVDGSSAGTSRPERQRNLGFGLYRALQEFGGWRVNPTGWSPYRLVTQLFGPWTPRFGPWKRLRIHEPDAAERRRMAHQKWVFRAHRDHIHVAR